MTSSAPEINLPPVLWKPEDLGKPIGGSMDAISACLPTWDSVIGYEECDPKILNALQCGYPRFFIHPIIAALTSVILENHGVRDQFGLVFLDRKAAERACDYLSGKGANGCEVIDCGSQPVPHFLTVCPHAYESDARYFWRLAGEGISSRGARSILRFYQQKAEIPPFKPTQPLIDSLKSQIAGFCHLAPDDVFLFSSGMSAIFNLNRAIESISPGKKHIQVGFPYVDTWKVLTSFNEDQSIQIALDDDSVSQFLRSQNVKNGVAAVYSECPSNPLLETPDPELLRDFCDRYHGFLVIDDTIASSINMDPTPYADVMTTSLSKWFNGKGNVLAGALILNPAKPRYRELRDAIASDYSPNLFIEDLEVLASNAGGFAQRVESAGKNAEAVVEYLEKSPFVEKVFYCSREKDPSYRKLAREGSTMPALLSMVIDPTQANHKKFYDALRMSKGPSLGTDWSLACPYTLLAHYNELDWVTRCGVSPDLIRISCGSEPTSDLIKALENAFSAARI